MRASEAAKLVIAFTLLTAAMSSVCYGMIAWHAATFTLEGIWLYDNGWRPHPVHFIALGVGVAGPMAWEIFALALMSAEHQYDAEQRARQPAVPQARTRPATVVLGSDDEAARQPAVAGNAQTVRAPANPMSPVTFVRPIRTADRREFLALTQDGRDFHAPWIKAPLTPHSFKVYLKRTERDDHAGFAVCLRESGEMVGVVNLNNVLGGALRSASIAYFVAKAHADKGYMRDGLLQLKAHAFRELGLHRLEANIQPGNTASISLVRSCGFRHEGVSPRFMYIDGAWRDHERWAAVDDREALR